ncbi:MAG: penicillin-binding protein activator, partial [Gammaproteobacteria bacterium]
MFRALLLLIAILVVAGCTSQPARVSPVSQPKSPEQLANETLARGDFEGAAGQFASLADHAEPDKSATHRLQAALLYLDLGMPESAHPLLTENVSPRTDDASRQLLVEAISALPINPPQAIALLQTSDLTGFDAYEKGLYARTLGKAQLLAGDLNAVINLLSAELFPLPQSRRTELTHLIWDAFGGRHPPAAQINQGNPNHPGWLALLDETSRLELSPTELSERLGEWRLRFPQHPANEILIDEIIEQAEELAAPVHNVALLLPFDGELAGFAAAIRDGFVAARFSAHDMGLAINTYPASGESVRTAYDQAVRDGAQFAVGPLDKPGLESLIRHPLRTIPVLALNSLTSPVVGAAPSSNLSARVIQFGLTPEDEAEDLAHRAWRDGHRRMAMMTPNNELGARLSTAFRARWENLGGVVVEESHYSSNVAAYKTAIRQTFSLAQSEGRAAALRRILQRPLEFVSRPRADLDAIMLVALPIDARQIIPQFRYLGVDHLPIYSTSHVFAGGGYD